jgi:hypothetical protein
MGGAAGAGPDKMPRVWYLDGGGLPLHPRGAQRRGPERNREGGGGEKL